MPYTIFQTLSDPLMKEAKVLSGKDLIKSRVIESVSVIELPVEKFVKRNEFVLTTGIGCDKSEDVLNSFVKDVYNSDASALAIATGKYIASVPNQIIRFSQNHNFPIIQLPWEIRFSDIINVIQAGINEWDQKSLQKSDELQRQIIQLYLDGGSVNDALTKIGHYYKKNIYLQTSDDCTFSRKINGLPRRDRKILLKDNSPAIIETSRKTRAQVYPFRILSHKKAAIILESDLNDSPILPWSLIEQFVIILQLWFKKEQIMSERENKQKRDLIYKLIKGDTAGIQNEEINRFDPAGKYICIVGYPETETNDNEVPVNKNDMEAAANNQLTDLNVPGICAFYANHLVIFSQIKQDPHKIYPLIDAIENEFKIHDYPIFSWGIFDEPTPVNLLAGCYKKAQTALDIGKNQKGIGSRTLFNDTSEFQLLLQLSQSGVSQKIVKNIIDPLVKYNQKRGLDLFHTLTCYIQCQGNVSQTARLLSLQRQSLIYRLQKIESLTGKTLSKSDDLFLLQLCIKIWSINMSSI